MHKKPVLDNGIYCVALDAESTDAELFTWTSLQVNLCTSRVESANAQPAKHKTSKCKSHHKNKGYLLRRLWRQIAKCLGEGLHLQRFGSYQ